ncbi:MAG: CHRD domain-containing protein [Betaproteobacteria bacterium]
MSNTLFVTAARRVAAAALIAGFTCGSAVAAVLNYSATLSGANESPPNASVAIGSVLVAVDTTALTMRVRANFSGLAGNTTASHIHCCTAVPGVSTAGVATTTPSFVGFPLGVTTGSMDQTYDMTQAGSYNAAFVTAQGGTVAGARTALFNGLAAGTAYFNVHTATFGGGEIRGFPVAGVGGPQRTFVSTGGSDANNCALLTPCRGFGAAVTAVAAGGEVIALDSGGYGPVTVTKSVTITAPAGVYAGISVLPGQDGVVVNGPFVIVTLKGLTINGQGGNAGIDFIQGAQLNIEGCEIANVGGSATAGILARAQGGKVIVRDTTVRDAQYVGIWVRQAAPGQATTLVADNVAVTNAVALGILLGGFPHLGTAEAYLSHVIVTGSSQTGIAADSNSGGATLASITNSTISGNMLGVSASGTGAKLIVATSTIARNANVGFQQGGSSVLLSRTDNTVHDNNAGGAQTSGTIGPLPPL